MKACIISIGDELLIGQVINTNAGYIGQLLTAVGIQTESVVTIGDDAGQIKSSVEQAMAKYPIVITTGGLGPTKDDITIRTIAELFDSELTFSEYAWEHLSDIIRKFGREPTDAHRQQCFLPEKANLMHNGMGTAPGLHFSIEGRHLFVLPGVPYEMRHLMKSGVLPAIHKAFANLADRRYRTFSTVGEGESRLAELIEDIESSLPEHFGIAYLPRLGQVRVRLFGAVDNESDNGLFEDVSKMLEDRLQRYLYSTENASLAEAVGQMLKKRGFTLSVAESCTGGYTGHLITAVPGSSEYFIGGGITYSNELKMSILGVQQATLVANGAVSEQTAREMAEGARNVFGSDIALSITGVAGPGGGSEEKPVGTVWMAVAGSSETFTRRFSFTKDRRRNIELSGVAALNMVRKFLMRNT